MYITPSLYHREQNKKWYENNSLDLFEHKQTLPLEFDLKSHSGHLKGFLSI